MSAVLLICSIEIMLEEEEETREREESKQVEKIIIPYIRWISTEIH
jgi:hypothetical protein